jgi:glycosyltransferase involved in cell wall biosynthesis
MARARDAGVADHFLYLGLIPYDHVLGLAGACEALINPSKFEGWSTPIEEAKALGAPLLLSDIAIHREQAPGARFFNPSSAEAAATALVQVASRKSTPRASVGDLVAAQNDRLSNHATALLATVVAAKASRRGHG